MNERLTCRLSLVLVALAFLLDGTLHAQSWRSTLYPENWQRPDESASFYNDKIIQDFSYAGYKRGEQAIPNVTANIINAVTDHGADPTGTNDSTDEIQAAINEAQSDGGGVVLLPAGTYKVSPQTGQSYCLRISQSNVVIRGAGTESTYLLNTETNMRSKEVIRIWPSSTSTGSSVNLTADLNGPTHRLPVADASSFSVGDTILIEWDFTTDWIAEHNQQTYWNAGNGTPANARYYREITAKSDAENWIEIDAPTRYTMKTRDNARVSKFTGMLTDVGLEDFSMANMQNAKTTWGSNDYNVSGTGGYEAHASYLIEMRYATDCWIDNVHSYQPAGNTTGCHMLSNGILVSYAFRITVQDCDMRRSQYGGGGGNGYMYRLQYASECLVKNSVAEFNRHGFVTSHAGTSGNVFHQCEDRETKRSTGSTGSYETGGSGSDNHMHFSHSNLWDGCSAHNSFFDARHRITFGSTPHALTSAHGLYWNTTGSGTRYSNIVLTDQGRYGYAIGTQGSRNGISTTGREGSPTTLPVDHAEGQGIGDQLQPASLYLDQVARRLAPTVTYKGNGNDGGSVPVDGSSPYTPGASVTILGPGSMTRSGFTFGGWNTEADGSGADYPVSATFDIDNHLVLYAQWLGASLTVTFDARGGSAPVPSNKSINVGAPYGTLPTSSRDGFNFKGWFTAPAGGSLVTASTMVTNESNHTLHAQWSINATLQSKDQIIGLRQTSAPALDYYPDANQNLVGTTGSSATQTRYTANLVMGYSLPTLPVGTTVDSAEFHFEITASRDNGNVDPSVQVHLLDVANPDATGDTHFFTGSPDPSGDVHLVGSSYIEVGTTEVTYADDEYDQSYTLSGAALEVLRGYYGGDHTPERSEVFFRFSLDKVADINRLDRYRIDLANDESSLEISVAAPFDIWGGGASFAGDSNGDGLADGLAWLLDSATPATPGNNLLPTIQESTGDLISTFRMLKASARGNGVLMLQYSNDLGASDAWSSHTITVPDSSSTVGGVGFVITPASGEDHNDVQVTIPASEAGSEGKLFMRLMGELQDP